MVSSEVPHEPLSEAVIVTLPAFSIVMRTPPLVSPRSICTIVGSDADHFTAAPLTPFATAGIWKVCELPSMYAEYIGLNEMGRLFAVHGPSLPPPPPAPAFPAGVSPSPVGLSEEQPSVLSPSVPEEMAASVRTRRVESAFMTYTFSSDSNDDGGPYFRPRCSIDDFIERKRRDARRHRARG